MAGIISDRLKHKKEAILSRWETRCLSEVPSAGSAASLALRDSVPIYLDHLSEALATNKRMDFKTAFARDQESARIGKMHGADRASNRNYMLTEVIFEYHLLREVIFEALEEDDSLPTVQRDIILDSIEQAVNDAAVEFSEAYTDLQQAFVNTLTHDLQNPITAAKSNADLVLRRPDVSEPTIRSTKRIIGNLNRLTAMIHDLLDANRIRAGEPLVLHVTEGDLDLVIRDVVSEMSIIHGERFVLKSEGPVQGKWDSDALMRAIENLIVNAVKYGEPDAPITIILRRMDHAAEVTIHNEGAPISDLDIPQLFQQFRRSRSAQEGAQAGWGLGLTLVKGVVDAHKGKIRVESAEGKGTSFILEIPLAVDADTASREKSAKSA